MMSKTQTKSSAPPAAKDRVFRDPVHGIIEFGGADRPLANILETRAFQRLRHIKQMGFAWLVYPGAEHSRFGHALGAFHIATRVVTRLELDATVARHVRLAALLHDLGHGPFSHSWEQVFPEIDHESWGARIVSEDAELGAVLEDIEPGLAGQLANFWSKDYQPAYARKLVSSQLDVDRLDYLLRDGHYSGAGYATYDLDWILHALRLEAVHEGDNPTDLVVDYRRGMFAVEQYLFARTYMYAQVYHHKTVRAAEWMFLKLLTRFRELAEKNREPSGLEKVAAMCRGAQLSVDDYLELDDISVTGAIRSWARGAEDKVLSDLSARLVARHLFKTIDLGDDPAVIERLRQSVAEAAVGKLGEHAHFYYHLDTAEQIGYGPKSNRDELFVVGHPKSGTVTLGQLLEELPLGRPSKTVRLVCAPELLSVLRPIIQKTLSEH